MRKMYDSTTAADIPADAQMIAGYVDDTYRWSDADWARFPSAVHVRIAVLPVTNDGHVLDIEPGNADALSALAWIEKRRAAGVEPTVYCFSDAGPVGYRISDVRKACDDANVKHPSFWIAQWDNDPSTFDPTGDPEIVAKQYADSAMTGGHYDASVVADYWPGVDMTPEQEAKLDLLLAKADAILARQDEPMVWTARAQRSLDVETGKVFDQKVLAKDARIVQ